jgi:hypothetical protein
MCRSKKSHPCALIARVPSRPRQELVDHSSSSGRVMYGGASYALNAHKSPDRDEVILPGASCIWAPVFFSAKREGSKR